MKFRFNPLPILYIYIRNLKAHYYEFSSLTGYSTKYINISEIDVAIYYNFVVGYLIFYKFGQIWPQQPQFLYLNTFSTISIILVS